MMVNEEERRILTDQLSVKVGKADHVGPLKPCLKSGSDHNIDFFFPGKSTTHFSKASQIPKRVNESMKLDSLSRTSRF